MQMEHDLGFRLGRSHRAMRSFLVRELSTLGYSFEQYQTLLSLSQGDDIPQNVLADRLSLEPTYTTRMLQRVEKTGLISRERDAVDTRIVRVTITPQGRAAWERLEAVREECLERVRASMGLQCAEELRGLLDTLYDSVTELAQSES